MKTLYIVLLLVLFQTIASAQTAPTLSAGLESLTFNKGNINVDTLTKIILKKQKELKQEALKRFILKLFPADNITTKYYLQSSLDILINEKNPKVIEKEIIELTTNYALSLGIAKAFRSDAANATALEKLFNNTYIKTSLYSTQLIKKLDVTKSDDKLSAYKAQLKELSNKAAAKNIEINNEADIAKKREKLKSLKEIQADLTNVRKNIAAIDLDNSYNVTSYNSSSQSIPFSIILDITSTVLSNNDSLQKKGFFKNKINYKQADFYQDMLTDGSATSMEMVKGFDGLYTQISDFINPYINNYDVIKEFFSAKITPKKGASVIAELSNRYLQQISESIGESQLADLVKSTVASDRANLNLEDVQYSQKFAEIKSDKAKADLLKNLTSQITAISTKRDSLATVSEQFKKLADNTNTSEDAAGKLFFQPGITRSDSLTIVSLQLNRDRLKKEFGDTKTDIIAFINNNKRLINLTTALQSVNTDKFGDAFTTVSNKFTEINTELTGHYKELAGTNYFYQLYLNSLLKRFITLKDFTVTNDNADQNEKYADFLAKAYNKLYSFSKQEKINISDIYYIENEIVPGFVKYGVQFNGDSTKLTSLINNFVTLSGLLKIKAINSVDPGFNKFNAELVDLFRFVSNLDNLDQAETYQNMISLLRFANGKVEENLEDSEFKDLYVLFINAVKKYTIINSQKQYVELDVASFLNELAQYYNSHDRSNFNLYLTLGLNQNLFFKGTELPGSTGKINNIGFASEKIGLKFRIKNFRLTSGYDNVIKTDVNLNKRSPFVNEWYTIIYGSGLLYSIANTSTEKNFNYPHIGIGTGLRFYNSLDVNFVLGLPFIKNENPFKFAFLGIGLDIPLGEYLERIGN